MSEKVTPENLKKYGIEFCAIVLANAYKEKETLSGHELLKLTPVRKINQHLVARLSAHWKSQIQQFNSPYFDFEAEEVKAALEHFSNVVSQHISLRREHLQPWLLDIVDKTLAPLAANDQLQEGQEELIRQFSVVHPLHLSFPEKTVVANSPATPSVSFFNLAEDEPLEDTPSAATPPTLPSSDQAPEPEATAPATGQPSRSSESVNSRFKVALPEYSSDLQYGSVHVKLESIRENISLAQRFMFVGQLFKGDFDAFNEAVNTLDNAADLSTAYAYLTKNLAEKYDWDLNSEAVIEFLSLIRRRFS